jgi:hypothetical protein
MAATMIAVADAIDLLVAATEAAATIAPIIQKAQAEGRTTLTPDEWTQITGDELSAEAALSAAIAAAKALGK